MEQKINSVTSAETNDDSSTNVDVAGSVHHHSSNTLLAAGFRFDSEDNVWYDESYKRDMWYYRIKKCDRSNFYMLYGGGFNNEIARNVNLDELLSNVI